MLKGKDWVKCFNNPENKKYLIKLACSYFQRDRDKALSEIPLIINSSENAWAIIKEKIQNLEMLINHEADKRLIFPAGINDKAVAILLQKIQTCFYF